MNLKQFVRAAAVMLATTLVLPVQAATVTFNLSQVFSDGAVAPDGPAPYATVTLDDGGGSGSVVMTLSISGDVGAADLTELYLNFDPNLTLGNLNFAYDGSSTGPAAINSPIDVGTNAFQSDGDGKFDIFFNFPTSAPNVSAGDTVIYNITSSDAITANSFNFLSDMGGGEGTYLAASKWQSTGPAPFNDSAWVGASPVPVPAAVWLFGSGLIGLVAVARRKKQ